MLRDSTCVASGFDTIGARNYSGKMILVCKMIHKFWAPPEHDQKLKKTYTLESRVDAAEQLGIGWPKMMLGNCCLNTTETALLHVALR